MKIRTDFVTNSSSSSFVVEIKVKTTDGREFIQAVDPDDGGGNGNVEVNCTAEEILAASSVEELANILSGGIEAIEPEGADEWYGEKLEEFLFHFVPLLNGPQPHSHMKGDAGNLGSIPGQGTRSHMPQLKILHAPTMTPVQPNK